MDISFEGPDWDFGKVFEWSQMTILKIWSDLWELVELFMFYLMSKGHYLVQGFMQKPLAILELVLVLQCWGCYSWDQMPQVFSVWGRQDPLKPPRLLRCHSDYLHSSSTTLLYFPCSFYRFWGYEVKVHRYWWWRDSNRIIFSRLFWPNCWAISPKNLF